MSDAIDYAALIAERRITGRVPITLAPGRVVNVVLRAIHEERMWEMEQTWPTLPEAEQGRASDKAVLAESFDHFETTEGEPIESLGTKDYAALLARLNRAERLKLLTEAVRLFMEAPSDPLSAAPSEPTTD